MKLFAGLLLGAFAPLITSQDLEDIPGTAIAAGSFDVLVAALAATELVGAVSEPNGPFTVFAPTDDAFASLPEGLVDCLLEPTNLGVLSNILTYHVLEGEVFSENLTDNSTAIALNGLEIEIDLSDGVMINQAMVVAADIVASNGVIHVIDSVLVPPGTDVPAFLESCTKPDLLDIPATAIAASGFETLVAALTAADLVGAVSAPAGPFTVFAPADAAFAALPEGLVACLLLPENLPALTAILTYHVLSGAVLSTDLSQGLAAETLQGEDVVVDLTDGVKINDATVVAADILASNGVIHVIDSVLVPPSISVGAFLETCPGTSPEEMPLMDIPGVAVEAGSFTTLVAALSAAGLVEAVSAPNGPYTVFAPTDDAFAALPEVLVGCLLKEEFLQELTTVLLYHVVEGEVFSTDLFQNQTAETLSGFSVTVDLTDGVFIDESEVVAADIPASNGVIHVIDSVLVPSAVDVGAFLEACEAAETSVPDEPAATTAPSATPEDSAAPATKGIFGLLAASVFALLAL